MSGSLSVPNTFGAASGNVPASQLDNNYAAIVNYVNAREITVGLIAARPAFGTAGRYYLATDVSGGTLYVDTGTAWVQVAAGVTASASQSSAQARNSVALAIPNNTVTSITFDTEVWDDAAFFTVAQPDRFTIPATGKYQFFAEVDWDPSATSDGKTYEMFVILNNVTLLADQVQYPGANNAAVRAIISGVSSLVAGDFIGVQVLQTSGAPLNAAANSPRSPSFSIVRIS